MYTIEEIKKLHNEMKVAINAKFEGKLIHIDKLDDFYNSVDENVFFVAEGVEDETHGKVNLIFIIGRAATVTEDGFCELEASLTVQTRDLEDGLLEEEDYFPEGLTEEEALTGCFVPFVDRLNRYAA